MVDSTTFTVDTNNLTMRIQQAEMYLKEYENEVKRAQCGTPIFRSREVREKTHYPGSRSLMNLLRTIRG